VDLRRRKMTSTHDVYNGFVALVDSITVP
jgi:hypothetical protein